MQNSYVKNSYCIVRKIWLIIILSVIHRCYVSLQEVNRMPKSHDARKDKKKAPQKTAKEKKQAKREKKNK